MLQIIAAALLSSPTIDLPAGTMICASDTAAREYIEARAAGDEHRLHWLSGSVCHTVAMDFDNQTVLDADEYVTEIEWAYGRDREIRYVIRG